MNLRGMAVVGVILIILVSIVAIGIFLGVTLKFIKNSTSKDRVKCLGIDLKVTKCVIFLANNPLPNGGSIPTNHNLYFIVERGFGGGELKDLSFQLKYPTGQIEMLKPVNVSMPGFEIETISYHSFLEYSSKEFVSFPEDYVTEGLPSSLGVSAIVGKSNTLCEPTAPPLPCTIFQNT